VVRRLLAASPEREVLGLDWGRMPHGSAGVDDISDPRFAFSRADVRNTHTMHSLLRPDDVLVHLAAIVGDPACKRQSDLAREINEHASLRLIDAAGDAGVGHMIFVSTCSNYGLTEGVAHEESPLNPLSLYAETKVSVEEALMRSGLDATVLRLATVYGVAPRMRLDLTVNQFAVEAALDRRLDIFGADAWRPYVHVEDVARAITACVEAPDRAVGEVFNVGDSGENYTKRMLFELLSARIPDLTAEWTDTGPDLRSYRVAFEKATELLGFRITRRVPGGLDDVLQGVAGGRWQDRSNPIYSN
jgi:nucleoside-diphosphate-sugar epimerase